MLGNGSGLEWENKNNNEFTHYGYLSYEKTLGKGKGYKLESFKFYSWFQKGKRGLLVHTPFLNLLKFQRDMTDIIE